MLAEDSAEAEGVVPTDDGAEASQVGEQLGIFVIFHVSHEVSGGKRQQTVLPCRPTNFLPWRRETMAPPRRQCPWTKKSP